MTATERPPATRAQPITMRAATIESARTIALRELPVPTPGPGQIRLAVQGCGVCGSDLPVWEGRPWFHYPRDPGGPGHEAWGLVDALGPGVAGLRVGDHVAAIGYHSYADYDVVAADAVVTLPSALHDTPFPAEPLGCAANVIERSGIVSGDTVAVIGTGFLGALIVGLAAARGARVIALSRRATSREAAATMGAQLLLASDATAVERIAQETGDRMCDVVVEAAGTQEALDLCGPLTRVRGRVVIAGFHQDGPRTVDMQLWNWRGLDVVNAHERDPARYVAGIERAVGAATSGELDAAPLITHRFPLERIEDAFAMLARRPEGFVKAVVVP